MNNQYVDQSYLLSWILIRLAKQIKIYTYWWERKDSNPLSRSTWSTVRPAACYGLLAPIGCGVENRTLKDLTYEASLDTRPLRNITENDTPTRTAKSPRHHRRNRTPFQPCALKVRPYAHTVFWLAGRWGVEPLAASFGDLCLPGRLTLPTCIIS